MVIIDIAIDIVNTIKIDLVEGRARRGREDAEERIN
jgi:hypothetical protein